MEREARATGAAFPEAGKAGYLPRKLRPDRKRDTSTSKRETTVTLARLIGAANVTTSLTERAEPRRRIAR